MYIETDDWIHFEETDMPFLAALGWEQAVQTVLAHQAAHGDFPFLYDPLQLAAFLCTNRKNLFDLVNHAEGHYRRLELWKKSGGVRILHVPDDELKVIQRRILRQILMKFSPVGVRLGVCAQADAGAECRAPCWKAAPSETGYCGFLRQHPV